MIKFIYSVYDSKARTFSNPFVSMRQEMAIRDFTQAARDPQSQISNFPEDYTLFEMGEFDDEIGTFNTHSQPINLGMASLYKE